MRDVVTHCVGAFDFVRHFFSSIYKREPWMAEFVSGLVCVLWGLIALTSGYEFEGATPYRELLRNLDISTIGMYVLSVGGLQLVALAMEHRRGRWLSAIFVSWFPSLIITCFVSAPPLTPNLAPYLGWAGINIYAIVRHGRRMA